MNWLVIEISAEWCCPHGVGKSWTMMPTPRLPGRCLTRRFLNSGLWRSLVTTKQWPSMEWSRDLWHPWGWTWMESGNGATKNVAARVIQRHRLWRNWLVWAGPRRQTSPAPFPWSVDNWHGKSNGAKGPQWCLLVFKPHDLIRYDLP